MRGRRAGAVVSVTGSCWRTPTLDLSHGSRFERYSAGETYDQDYRETGLGAFYKALSPGGNPEFSTVLKRRAARPVSAFTQRLTFNKLSRIDDRFYRRDGIDAKSLDRKNLAPELSRRKYSAESIGKIVGGNMMRALRSELC